MPLEHQNKDIKRIFEFLNWKQTILCKKLFFFSSQHKRSICKSRPTLFKLQLMSTIRAILSQRRLFIDLLYWKNESNTFLTFSEVILKLMTQVL